MNRLDSISKGLSDKIIRCQNKKQKEILIQACEYAISKSNINNSTIIDVITSYKNGTLDTSRKEYIEKLVEEYENEYFDLQEAGEKDITKKDEYLVPFGKARALSTVLYCFENDLALSTIEAVYEAAMVDKDYLGFLQTIEHALIS